MTCLFGKCTNWLCGLMVVVIRIMKLGKCAAGAAFSIAHLKTALRKRRKRTKKGRKGATYIAYATMWEGNVAGFH